MCALITQWHSIIPQHKCSDYPLTQYYTPTSVLRLPTDIALYPNICAQITHWHSIIPNMRALIIHWHSIISQHVCTDYPMTQYYTPTCVLWLPTDTASVLRLPTDIALYPTCVLRLPTDTVLYPNKCAQITHWHSIIPQHVFPDYPLTQYYTPTVVYGLSTDTVLDPIPYICPLITHWHSIRPHPIHLSSHYPLTQY